MVYEEINEFIIIAKISRSTFYRFYKKNKELWSQTKKKGKKRLVPVAHTKYFDSDALFDELKIASLEIKSLRNLIKCLADNSTLPRMLWDMQWSFFFTVAYRNERNKKSCFRLMNLLNDELIEKYGDETNLRLFFTTEPFNNRKGFHNHFVLYVENKKIEPLICSHVKNFFKHDRVDVSPYDMFQAGLFYISKDGLQGEDWDILKN